MAIEAFTHEQQLAFLGVIHEEVRKGTGPVIVAYPDAGDLQRMILSLTESVKASRACVCDDRKEVKKKGL